MGVNMFFMRTKTAFVPSPNIKSQETLTLACCPRLAKRPWVLLASYQWQKITQKKTTNKQQKSDSNNFEFCFLFLVLHSFEAQEDVEVSATEGNVAVLPCSPPGGNPTPVTVFQVNSTTIDQSSGEWRSVSSAFVVLGECV